MARDNGRKFACGENRRWSGEESPDLGWSSYGILEQRREEFFNGGITNESSYRSSWEGRPEDYSFVESLSEPLYYFFSVESEQKLGMWVWQTGKTHLEPNPVELGL